MWKQSEHTQIAAHTHTHIFAMPLCHLTKFLISSRGVPRMNARFGFMDDDWLAGLAQMFAFQFVPLGQWLNPRFVFENWAILSRMNNLFEKFLIIYDLDETLCARFFMTKEVIALRKFFHTIFQIIFAPVPSQRQLKYHKLCSLWTNLAFLSKNVIFF